MCTHVTETISRFISFPSARRSQGLFHRITNPSANYIYRIRLTIRTSTICDYDKGVSQLFPLQQIFPRSPDKKYIVSMVWPYPCVKNMYFVLYVPLHPYQTTIDNPIRFEVYYVSDCDEAWRRGKWFLVQTIWEGRAWERGSHGNRCTLKQTSKILNILNFTL